MMDQNIGWEEYVSRDGNLPSFSPFRYTTYYLPSHVCYTFCFPEGFYHYTQIFSRGQQQDIQIHHNHGGPTAIPGTLEN
jgi:hypothetical protein